MPEIANSAIFPPWVTPRTGAGCALGLWVTVIVSVAGVPVAEGVTLLGFTVQDAPAGAMHDSATTSEKPLRPATLAVVLPDCPTPMVNVLLENVAL
jgi:hypothetical protein